MGHSLSNAIFLGPLSVSKKNAGELFSWEYFHSQFSLYSMP